MDDRRSDAWTTQAKEQEGLERESLRTLELREEVPEVTVERIPAGSVTVRREVKTWTETVEVELREETLVISRATDGTEGRVIVDGELLDAGAETRVVIYREEARAEKVPVVAEQVEITRDVVTERRSIPVELHREVLDVREDGNAIVREDVR